MLPGNTKINFEHDSLDIVRYPEDIVNQFQSKDQELLLRMFQEKFVSHQEVVVEEVEVLVEDLVVAMVLGMEEEDQVQVLEAMLIIGRMLYRMVKINMFWRRGKLMLLRMLELKKPNKHQTPVNN